MLGSIIHNANVVARAGAAGSPPGGLPRMQVHPGDTVIIRSHGETRAGAGAAGGHGASACVNATCPNVLHIQQLVSQAGQEGRMPLVIGEPHHPEVMGAGQLVRTVRWCFRGRRSWSDGCWRTRHRRDLPLTAVAQTTCIRSALGKFLKNSKKRVYKRRNYLIQYVMLRINVNRKRRRLAARVDVMVVVGDRKSANTKHLTEICSERLSPGLSDRRGRMSFTPDFLQGMFRVAGLTAGASTPAGIIKEVNDNDERRNQEHRSHGRVL